MFLQNIFLKIKQIFDRQFLLAVLFLFLFFVGFWQLSYRPATWYDEGINAGIAKSLVEDGVYSLKIGPNEFVETRQFLITTNYPVILPVALFYKIFGADIGLVRIPMIFYLILFAVFVYLIVKKWFGEKEALWSLLLVVLFLPFYGNGKSVLGEVAGLFFLISGLYFLSDKKLSKLFLAGSFLGLSVATKPFFILVIPALFVGEGHRVYKSGFRKFNAYLILFLSGLVPILFWFWTINPNFSFNSLGTAVGYYANSYADNTNLGYLLFSNLKRFFSETTPIHFFVMFTISLLALAPTIRKKEAPAEQVALLFFIILNFLWYLKTPGWYRYFFPAHLLLFIFFPFALSKIFSKKIFLAIIIFFVIVQSTMLFSKRNEPLYFSTEVQNFSKYVQEQTTKDDSILVVNGPSVAFLLDNSFVSQYVRINPQLVFTPKNILIDAENINQNYIIAGSLNEEDSKVRNILDVKYEQLKTIGHYTLFKSK